MIRLYFFLAGIYLLILAFATTGRAEAILIVPPNGVYLDQVEFVCTKPGPPMGSDAYRACRAVKRQISRASFRILSNMNTTVFENIHSGITDFNNNFHAVKKGINYRVRNYSPPNFLYSENIKKFYDRLSELTRHKTKEKLYLLCSRNNSDCITWAEFEQNTETQIRRCLNTPQINDVYITLQLNFCSDKGITHEEIRLKFKKDFYDLSYKSRIAIRDQICNYLKKKHDIAENKNQILR